MSGVATALRSQRAYIDGLSEEDRQALLRGEGMLPSERRRRRCTRVIKGVSKEAHGLFTLLSRSEGRSVRSLMQSGGVGGNLSSAIAELESLGLVEVTGTGVERRVGLLPAAEGVGLFPTWSMVDGAIYRAQR
jgi:hypothetical protein